MRMSYRAEIIDAIAQTYDECVKLDVDDHGTASRIAKRIILIDGIQLARLMVEREVGVTISETYKVKKIDENYFIEA